MTVAAVDRLVHHALIVEIHTDSYRKQSAAKRSSQTETSQAEAISNLAIVIFLSIIVVA